MATWFFHELEDFLEDAEKLNPDWREYTSIDQVVLPKEVYGAIAAKADQRSRERVICVLMASASPCGSADSEIQKAEVAEIAADVTGLANTLDSSGLMRLLVNIQHKHSEGREAPAFVVTDERDFAFCRF